MTLFRTVLFTSGLVLALSSGAAQAQPGAQRAPANPAANGDAGLRSQVLTDAKPMVTLQMPALPAPVAVTLAPKTTALLVFDYVEAICNGQQKCKDGMLPALTPFMARARKAGLVVAYGTRMENVGKWLPEIAPQPGDITIVNTAQDRFYNTDLDKELKAKGITTVILAGWKVSGSVAYSSVGATLRGYTVVVPVDTTAATADYEQTIGFFNILNQLNGNLPNQPLKPNAPTLSRTDMITFQ
jgi:nicotinamidase-related amidase